MSKITGVVIAKNEEEMIEECLDSLSFCDQLIVIDNNSSDLTGEIAREKGAKVYLSSEKDFARLREFALDKVKTRWLFYVDADERVTDDLANEIRSKINDQRSKISVFRITRKNYYLGKHEWPAKEHLERLFLKAKLKGWKGELHETAVFEGELGDLKGDLKHFTHRTLSTMVEKTNNWSEKEARLRLKAGHPPMTWWRFPRVMLQAFYVSFIREKGWKTGTAGLVESIYQAFSIFVTYAKLWELQKKEV